MGIVYDAGSERAAGGRMIYAKVAAAIALLAALVAGYFAIELHGVTQGRAEVQNKWDAETVTRKTAEAAAVIARVAENKQIVDQQQLDNQRITKAHNDEINSVRAAIARAPGLRIGAALCSGFASAPDTVGAGSGDDADPRTRLLPDALDRDIKALILEVEEVASTGRACQSFVRAGGMAPQLSTP